VPDGWVIFAAGNRQGDRGVTYAMPAPLANRFTHYEVEVNLDDWIGWAHSEDIDSRVIAFLRFRPDLLFSFDPLITPSRFPARVPGNTRTARCKSSTEPRCSLMR